MTTQKQSKHLGIMKSVVVILCTPGRQLVEVADGNLQ
jgi:hypothetical protein